MGSWPTRPAQRPHAGAPAAPSPSAALPFTPGGAGAQQALLAQVFGHSATAATVAAYSVGQQIAIAAFSFGVGFLALVFIFRIRSFKEVIQRGQADRAAEEKGAAEAPA